MDKIYKIKEELSWLEADIQSLSYEIGMGEFSFILYRMYFKLFKKPGLVEAMKPLQGERDKLQKELIRLEVINNI